MKLSSLVCGLFSAFAATSAFASNALDTSSLGDPVPVSQCQYVHHWYNFKSKNSSVWDVTISKGNGSPLFYQANCTAFNYADTSTKPFSVHSNSQPNLGFGYENSGVADLTYFVTAIYRGQSVSDVQGEPVPGPGPTPTPAHAKKCVFVVDAAKPTAPSVYILNYNHAACDFVPGDSTHSSQFLFQ